MALTSIAFLLAFLVSCMMAILRHPIYGLMTYVVILFVHPPDRWWGQGLLLNLRWSLIAALVTVVALYIRRTGKGNSSFLGKKIIWLILGFVAYAAVQLSWVYDPERQMLLIEYFLKFLIGMWLIYRCIESERHLAMFLWAYIIGSFYLSWVAYSDHMGGRFDSFGGAGFGDANSGALTLVTATFVAGSLLLVSLLRSRVVLVGMLPFIVNAIVMTISRSAFLAAAVGGIVFNIFTPKRFRRAVLGLSALALVVFLLLTNADYWHRIATIASKGETVEGVDTSAGRIDLMRAQLRMFRAHPLGCGHFCTDYLSASYLDKKFLDGGARSSHNTFLSYLVDQGFVGAGFYIAICIWVLVSLVKLAGKVNRLGGILQGVYPAVAAFFAALFVGDMFVPYVRYEPRFWFIAVILVMLRLAAQSEAAGSLDDSVPPAVPK